ncbi:hypothetical protein MNEG_2703 [Monoraphidium neglectum]|uniref:DUF676 domain-containing protein n=1 Tax=Monoraphidium neglectum TaxID=145388 RepID=A0A0D2LF07_9CHLO|nr:hypothetical protein MNEG_2703 [Monoraphidium neglectum]KIZ05254.1 hypothetical protein MNEG_2703 [Monoraphidium neglectum]|eukprot:XP_013904273.1 hypothetical protein MNEG_2703 [Monoraphidium neglectum]
MVNGLSGAPSNWDVLCEQLRKRLPPQVSADMLLHRSQANVRFATWDGIDRCGQRLADEVRAVAAAPENASLTRISFIGHSMGGLMARYALGVLFNPSAGTIAGLQPTHFITLATPHFGCDTDGVSAVPFITWSGGLPLLGDQIRGLLQGIAHATGAALLRRTGEHFFLLDGGGAADSAAPVPEAAPEKGRQRQTAFGTADADQPLLYQMTEDVPSKGLYFYSALKAFKTRTAYANTDGDHLVGWANSSLRPLDRLPPLPPEATREARGVVLEDPLPAAWDRDEWRKLQRLMANARSSGNGEPAAAAKLQEYRGSRAYEGPTSHPGQQVGGANGSSSSSSVWQALRNGSSSSSSSGGPNGSSGPQAASGSSDEDWGASADEDWATAAEANTAPEWGAESSAHNNIQVTRKVLNWQGKAVPRHLVEQLSAMERLLRDAGHAGAHSSKQSSPAGKAGGEGPDGAGMAGPQLATSVVGQ